jgi:arsenate reductase
MNILALCTGNSARSILLEVILNRLGADQGFRASSAGSKPSGCVHPQSLALLTSKGFPIEGLRSKSWDEFAAVDAPRMDAVITVCSSAAGETCPFWPGTPIRAHWGVDDSAAAPAEHQQEAFAYTFDILSGRAAAFLALSANRREPPHLSAELSKIGKL